MKRRLARVFLALALLGALPAHSATSRAKPARSPEQLRAEYIAKSEALERVKHQLLKEFVGFDALTERVMSYMEQVELKPQDVPNILFVPMISGPARGKTTYAQRLFELLGIEAKLRTILVKPGTKSFPTDSLINAANEKSTLRTNLQAGLLIDEAQNMVTPLEKDTNWHNLWNITGNGTYQVGGQQTKENLLSYWVTAIGPVPKAKEDLEGLLKKKEELERAATAKETELRSRFANEPEADEAKTLKAEAGKLRNEIYTLDQQQIPYARQVRDQMYNGLRQNIQYIFADRPEAFDFLKQKDLDPEQLTELFFNNPGLGSKFKPHLDRMPFDRTRRLKRAVVFLTANPEEMLEQVKKRFHAGKDQSLEHYARLTNEEMTDEKMWAIAEKLFGPDDGWQSRLGRHNWVFMKSLTPPELAEMVHRQVEAKGESVVEQFKKFALAPPRIEFDPSVEQMLYKEIEKDVTGAARAANSNATSLLGGHTTAIERQLIKMGDQRPHHIVVRFDAAGSQLIATSPEHADFRIVTKIGLAPRAKAVAHAERALEAGKQAQHLAGHLVQGAHEFGSAPERATTQMSSAEIAGDQLWKNPGNDFNHKIGQIRMLLAGGIAEDMLGHGYFSETSELNIVHAKELVHQLMENAVFRQNVLAFLEKPKPRPAEPPRPIFSSSPYGPGGSGSTGSSSERRETASSSSLGGTPSSPSSSSSTSRSEDSPASRPSSSDSERRPLGEFRREFPAPRPEEPPAPREFRVELPAVVTSVANAGEREFLTRAYSETREYLLQNRELLTQVATTIQDNGGAINHAELKAALSDHAGTFGHERHQMVLHTPVGAVNSGCLVSTATHSLDATAAVAETRPPAEGGMLLEHYDRAVTAISDTLGGHARSWMDWWSGGSTP